MPVDIGSQTHSTAAAVTAASTALPPSSSTRSAARVASGWLVAAIAWAATAAERRTVYCQVMPSSSPGQFAGSGVFE